MNSLQYILRTLFIAIGCCILNVAVAQQNEITDQNITDRIETEMSWQMDIPADQIDVRTKNAIVMLDGTVPNLLAKERASNLAAAVRGVRGVVNQIQVAPVKTDDATIRKNVLNALQNDPAADAYKVDITVSDGVATLGGEVHSWQERNLTAAVVKGTKGIVDIVNNITVNQADTRSDTEIQSEIEQALRNDIRLFPNPVDVNVKNGEVWLTGSVGNLNDFHLATNYAWTSGVNKVHTDGLRVEVWADNKNFKDKTFPVRSDREIREAVEDALMYDPRVFSFKPNISVANGVVTLSGTVSNLKAKRAATANARNVVGVAMVKNNLKVRPESIPADHILAARVENALGADPEVDRYDISVTAWSGNVYLNGMVDTYFEKNKAEDVAARVKGVVKVVNNLKVYFDRNYDYEYPDGISSYYYPTPYSSPDGYYNYPMTDSQIRNNIENEFWWSPFVNEFAIEVEVERGVATLTGTVRSWQEHNAAIENAYEGGAVSVIDELKINRADSSN